MGVLKRRPIPNAPPIRLRTSGTGGRPQHVPTEETRQTVRELAAIGTNHEDIAIAVGLSDGKYVRKYYRDDLYAGRMDANKQVANALFKNATEKNNLVAQIFWLKCQASWHENIDGERTKGPGLDRPINIKINFVKADGQKSISVRANVEQDSA